MKKWEGTARWKKKKTMNPSGKAHQRQSQGRHILLQQKRRQALQVCCGSSEAQPSCLRGHLCADF